MNMRRYGHLCMMLAVPLVFGVLLGACGSDSPTGQTSQTLSGVVTVGTATTGLKVCTACHVATTADWMASKHANIWPAGNLYSTGRPTLGQITGCTTNCHDSNNDGRSGNQFVLSVTGTNRPVVSCESCHSGGQLHVAQGGAGPIGFSTLMSMVIGSTSTLQVSAQFRTCTGCHELLSQTDPANNAATPVHQFAVMPTGSNFIITDTHFATAGVYSCIPPNNIGNCNNITGYAMDYSSEKVCSDCHNPHKNADINREWASSKHADKQSDHAWAHYNWSCDSSCFGPMGNRTSCQRCHTTTGFAAYANALQSGNVTLAEAIRLGKAPQLTPSKTGFKPEMLKCNGCHTDNRGHLRNPGAYKATYAIGAYAQATFQYPDVGASNVCMTCHTGRNSGKAISKVTGTTFDVFAYNNVDGHYLTAGGTMFKGPAYEYAGRDYTDPTTFRHKNIGTSAEPGTGTMGPCIGCHMDRNGMPGNHLFEPVVTVNGSLVVTSSVCFQCHAGSSIDFGTVVEDEKTNFGFALQALQNQLFVSTPSYSFTTAFPYIVNSSGLASSAWLVTWPTYTDTDVTGNSGGKNTMGAAFNASLLYHEPGAFVHNSRYVKRVLYDSIDWMDDGIMNYSVGATLNTACGGMTPPAWCAGAKKYLLYGAPNTSGERP